QKLKVKKQRIKVLFQSQIHSIIQNIKKTVLLSEHVNLFIIRIESETANQKMRNFEI
ncbi:hypothetical protein EMCG_07336, partial [[Emmonsia] crescens]